MRKKLPSLYVLFLLVASVAIMPMLGETILKALILVLTGVFIGMAIVIVLDFVYRD